LVFSFAYQGHLYTLLQHDFSVEIHHISRKSLQSGRCEQSGQYSSQLSSPASSFLVPNGHKFYHWTPSSITPFYGITAVFARVEWDSTHALVAAFYFLPNTLTHASNDGMSPPLAFDSPCVTELVHGELFDVNTCWLDHSGCNMVAAIQESADSSLRLALVRTPRRDPPLITTSVSLTPSISETLTRFLLTILPAPFTWWTIKECCRRCATFRHFASMIIARQVILERGICAITMFPITV
jgi:hypothetical protein